MKIRITGKKLQSYDPGGGVGNTNPFKIKFPMPAVGAEPTAEEAPPEYFTQQPVKEKTFAEQVAASGIGPTAQPVQKLDMTKPAPQLSGWDQLANRNAKISDSLMDQTYGNPFSLYNMAGFASNVVDGINNRKDRKRAESRENDMYSTMGMYNVQDPGMLSRGIRAVSGTQRNKDIPDQVSGFNSWQGMNQMYNSPFRAELGLTVDSIMGSPETMAEFTPMGPGRPSINTGAGPVAPPATDPLVFNSGAGSDDLSNFIAQKESGGNYGALPKDKNGNLVSSAVGKYQFLWNSHKSWISKLTGVEDKEAFRKNPEAQEKAFQYWDETVLTPNALKIQKQYGVQADLNKIKYMVHFAGPKGAEDYFSGKKETVDGFGMTTSKLWKRMEDGGQQTDNNSPMKIRITNTPQESSSLKIRITGGPEKMEYGGQSGYGLDLGQRDVYADMQDDPTESASNMLTEKSEGQMQDGEYPVIMAEDKETVVSDMDGDGGLEFKKISGDPHSAPSGGTKLTNLQLNPDPEKNGQGAFIFSHKLKEKDQDVLKQFNMPTKRGGYSYADMSKKFDTTEEKKMLDNRNADPLTKKTMELSKGRKESMLQKLANRQEEIKGFPQGQPDINKSLATMARGGMIYDFMDYAQDGIQKVDPPPGYRQRTPQLNNEREMADFNSIEDIARFYGRQGYTGGADIGAWQNWMAQQAQSNPRMKSRLTNYLRSVPLTNKGRSLYGQNASQDKLTDQQLIEQFQDGKWDFRAPKFYEPVKVEVPRRSLPPLTTPNIIRDLKGNIPPPPPDKIPPPPGTIPSSVKRGEQYLPYNAIQKANTLWAASRPVKGYFDRTFNANITGAQAMFDDTNYDPLLSANATRMDFMNQFGNAQAARASGTYNPQLNEGLVGETDRVRKTNLQIGNQTLSSNNQLFNQDAMMRAKEADQVRENNIRTREQMDIAKNLKYNDVMKNYGKMVNDHVTMQKYNLMNPQFAVTGPLWNKFAFTKGRAFGTAGNAGTGSPFMSKDEFFKSNKGFAAAYNSADPKLQMQADQAYQQYINQQRSMMMRSGANMQANMNNPFYMGNMGYDQDV